MFLSVTNDKSNKVTDYSELNDIEITQEIINEIQIGIDYFQLNQTNPKLFDLLINKFNNQNQNNQNQNQNQKTKKKKNKCLIF
ncbi:hypothetical protein M0811_09723 [Anaeramoeba ignava]|uniref:Uncharacterized protein n=1 Tax=Anaeramoeba ignava TaxID=1746090 RepID=A0A9Q0LGQ0_ANAIG|nr:hypothetical protein M0811_09723 [Anaeramoeba ignava]